MNLFQLHSHRWTYAWLAADTDLALELGLNSPKLPAMSIAFHSLLGHINDCILGFILLIVLLLVITLWCIFNEPLLDQLRLPTQLLLSHAIEYSIGVRPGHNLLLYLALQSL